MKIIINATNITEDRPLREVERLINMGKAHLPEEHISIMPFNGCVLTQEELKIIEKHIPEVKPVPVKTFNEYIQDANLEITFEDLNDINIFREPVVTDIDPIEPIPVDRYVSFDEPKKAKKKFFHR